MEEDLFNGPGIGNDFVYGNLVSTNLVLSRSRRDFNVPYFKLVVLLSMMFWIV